jgi:hypothetical protein
VPRFLTPYETAQAQGRLWTPSNISAALVGWWDAADMRTITLISGAVSAWADKSGKERTLSQSTAANRPLYTLRQSVDFTAGNSHWLETSAWSGGTESELLLCAIFTSAVRQNGTFAYSQGGGSGSNDRSGAHLPWEDGVAYFDQNEPTGALRTSAAWGGAASTQHNWTFVKSMSRNTQSISRDGALVSSNTPFNPTSILGGFGIGRYVNTYHTGSFCEVIFSRATAPFLVRQIEGYLAWKWRRLGCVGRLSPSHPFKNQPPLI